MGGASRSVKGGCVLGQCSMPVAMQAILGVTEAEDHGAEDEGAEGPDG
jgi:hypothetical protein